VPKLPSGVKTSNTIKSFVSRGKEGGTANSRRNSWDTLQATLGPATGGGEDLKPQKGGRKSLEEEGSCNRTISAGGPSALEENKERNTSQLPRLLC